MRFRCSGLRSRWRWGLRFGRCRRLCGMRFHFIAPGASDYLVGQALVQLDVFPVIPILIPGEGDGQQPIAIGGREGVTPETEIGLLETSRELVQQRFKLELALCTRQAHDFSL